mmetsp:Transcript_8141/g.19426  ORF Transcript_8141/g.19426 Transcript_8141/m.19426 type:complete len:434 (-) Transcript_8141:15-1316(-)
MACSVIRRSHIHVVFAPIINRLVQIADRHELVLNLAQEVQRRLDLLHGVRGFHSRRNDGDVLVLGGHTMRPRDHGDVYVRLASELLLRNDNLATAGIVRFRDGRPQDADSTDHTTDCPNLLGGYVGRVANHKRTFGNFVTTPDSTDLPIRIVLKPIHRLVQHVRPAVNSRQSRKPFWEATQAIDRVDERGQPIRVDGLNVQLEPINSRSKRQPQVAIICVQCHPVAQPIHAGVGQAKLLDDGGHRRSAGIQTLPGVRLFRIILHNPLKKVLHSILFHQANQIGLQSFHIRRWNLVNKLRRRNEPGLLELVDVSAFHRLPLQVPGNLRVQQNLNQLAACHHKLWNQIDVPITICSVLWGRCLARLELLPNCGEVQRRGLPTIVGVAIKVQDLLLVHRHQPRQNALLQTSAAHNHIVRFVHFKSKIGGTSGGETH